MPWVAAAAQWSFRKDRLADAIAMAVIAGGFVALSLLVGHLNATVIALVSVVLLAPAAIPEDAGVSRYPRILIRLLVLTCVIVAVAIALSLPQIVATMEYFKLVYKWYGEGFTSFPHIEPYEYFVQQSIKFGDLASLFTGDGNSVETGVEGRTLYVTWTGLVCIALVLSVWRSRKFAVIATCAALMVIVGITYAFSAQSRCLAGFIFTFQ